MQPTKPKTTKQASNPAMNLTSAQLNNMSEALLLRFSIDFHQLNNPNLKSLEAVSSDLGFTPQAVTNYIAGKGSIGFPGLIKLYKITNFELIPEWIEEQLRGIKPKGEKQL